MEEFTSPLKVALQILLMIYRYTEIFSFSEWIIVCRKCETFNTLHYLAPPRRNVEIPRYENGTALRGSHWAALCPWSHWSPWIWCPRGHSSLAKVWERRKGESVLHDRSVSSPLTSFSLVSCHSPGALVSMCGTEKWWNETLAWLEMWTDKWCVCLELSLERLTPFWKTGRSHGSERVCRQLSLGAGVSFDLVKCSIGLVPWLSSVHSSSKTLWKNR